MSDCETNTREEPPHDNLADVELAYRDWRQQQIDKGTLPDTFEEPFYAGFNAARADLEDEQHANAALSAENTRLHDLVESLDNNREALKKSWRLDTEQVEAERKMNLSKMRRISELERVRDLLTADLEAERERHKKTADAHLYALAERDDALKRGREHLSDLEATEAENHRYRQALEEIAKYRTPLVVTNKARRALGKDE